MKALHLLLAGAVTLLAIVSCKEDNIEPEQEPGTGEDEAWYAANATISSSDAHFAITEDGNGEISFKAEGGSVVVYVDCGTDWTADDSEAGVFSCDVQETFVTVTAGQNLVEEELYGTITLVTLPSQIHFATITVTQNAYGAPEITVETNEWNIPAVAADAEDFTTEIGVEATDDWEVESNAEWLTVEKGENSVVLTAAGNETTEERVAEVVLTCADGYNSDSETITVTQDARAYITLSEEVFEVGAKGGTDTLTVESNYEWKYASESEWFTIAENDDGSLTVTVDVNTVEEAREGVVTFTAGDGAANVAEATLTITQNAYGAPEITVETNEWNIPAVAADAEDFTTEIGVEATEEWEVESDAEWLTVEKGENSVVLTAAENETTEERVAEVVLTCADGYNSDSETITVTQDARAYITLSEEEFEFDKMGGEAEVTVESNYEWSYECEGDWFTVSENGDGSLTITADVNGTANSREGTVIFTAGDGAANTATATLTITQETFDPASLVLEYTITSDGTTIQLPMASYRYTIDCTVDWGDGETEAVSSNHPSHTYSDAGTYYVSISGTVDWLNSSSGGRECLTAVIQWGDIGLTRMVDAFSYCSNLASIPDGPGPFENVTEFTTAFLSCESLTTVPVDIFSNCTSVTIFMGVFSGCTNLTVAPSFAGLSKVTYFEDIFWGCTSLTTLPENMFSGCTGSNIFFTSAFEDCTSLTTVPVNIFTGCPSIVLCDSAFRGCSSVSGESPYDEITVDGETVKVHLYERANYPEYYDRPVDYYWCFENSTFSDIDNIPDDWK